MYESNFITFKLWVNDLRALMTYKFTSSNRVEAHTTTLHKIVHTTTSTLLWEKLFHSRTPKPRHAMRTEYHAKALAFHLLVVFKALHVASYKWDTCLMKNVCHDDGIKLMHICNIRAPCVAAWSYHLLSIWRAFNGTESRNYRPCKMLFGGALVPGIRSKSQRSG